MPFINAKVTVSLTEIQKEKIKTELGTIIATIPGKSETWLMVGLEDQYCLYFQGNQSAPSAFIEVKIFGTTTDAIYDKLTSQICTLFVNTLSIPSDRIYIKYEEVNHWGWNKENF